MKLSATCAGRDAESKRPKRRFDYLVQYWTCRRPTTAVLPRHVLESNRTTPPPRPLRRTRRFRRVTDIETAGDTISSLHAKAGQRRVRCVARGVRSPLDSVPRFTCDGAPSPTRRRGRAG